MTNEILYIGEPQSSVALLRRGEIPSHWFYGAVEMERDQRQVIWAQEKSGLFNDLRLIFKYNPKHIFIPNLNVRNHLVLLLLKALGLVRIPISAYLHHTPMSGGVLRRLFNKYIFRGVDHLFFLSKETMQDLITMKALATSRCIVPGWGPDQIFYDKIEVSKGDYFISTGKENRDFDVLIEAFQKVGAPLKIITAASHGTMDYRFLIEKCKNIPNIEVSIVENSGANYQQMLKLMAGAKALVCPLLQDKLNYCVGLSTIADAEGLNKPLIITRNPYHDSDRMRDFVQVTSVEEWIDAIDKIHYDKINQKPRSTYSMKTAYDNMRAIMFEN